MKTLLVNANNKINTHAKHILENNDELLEWLKSETSFLEVGSHIMWRLICVRDDIKELPLCEKCASDKVRFVKNGTVFKLSNTCSQQCAKSLAIQKGHKVRSPDWSKKLSDSLTRICESGKTVAQEASLKANETKKLMRYKSSVNHLHTPEIRARISESLRTSQKFKDSVGTFWRNATNSQLEERLLKIRQTRESKGDWVPIERLSEYQQYSRAVRQITRKQPIHSLEGHDNRGRGKLHLDHIIPIKFGFDNNIPPDVIGHISNLQFIPESENCSKQGKLK